MSVETGRQAHMLVVRMAREEKRNALNDAITAGIDAAMNELEDDPELWCGILTGDESASSAGARRPQRGCSSLPATTTAPRRLDNR